MKIVEIDRFAASQNDISDELWNALSDGNGGVCEYIAYERTPENLVVERCQDADIVLTNKVVFTREVMEQLPNLKYIGVMATGYNVVDIVAAREKGIVVTNIPAYSTHSVAQMAIAHLLHIVNNVAAHDDAVQAGKWQSCADFSFMVTPQTELAGKTFAVVGLGNTGMATAIVAHALGMKVMAYTSKSQKQLPEFISKADSLAALFVNADVLSLHCPLTESTHHLVNTDTLSLMKPTAILINTGRGPLVDEQALADALNENKLYAAGIDVLSQEPPVNGSPLIGAKNCHITPHIAWATFEARQRLVSIAIDNVKAFIGGAPQNVVNK